MKLLFDFFPVLLFFIAYKLHGIYSATAVAIVATFAQVGWVWLRQRRVEALHLVTLVLIVLFGGATLLLKDEMFIKWKPTVLDWLFALAFLASRYIGKKPLAERMMSRTVSLPPAVWSRLNLSWVVFFLALGLLNLYVVYHFDTAVWVDFRLFGMIGLTVIFALGQAVYMARHMESAPSAGEDH